MFLLTVVGINLLLSVLVLGEGKDGCEEDEEKPVGETEQDSDQLILKINRQIDDMMYGRRSEMKKREA